MVMQRFVLDPSDLLLANLMEESLTIADKYS